MSTGLAWLVTLAILALPIALAGVVLLRRHRRFATTGRRSPGRVVDVEAVEETRSTANGRRTVTRYYTVVTYAGPDGAPIQQREESGAPSPKHTAGEPIDVRYLPDAPTRFVIVGDDSNREAGVFGLILAGLLLLSGVLLVLAL